MTRKIALLFAYLTCHFAFAQTFPERSELFTRLPNGTYRIHATTEAVVTGQGKVDLLICQPFPESNRYQDITWLEELPSSLRSTYEETGHPYVKFAERVNAPTVVNINRDFVVSLYKVQFDWSAVSEVFPYDKSNEEYIRYTRRYPCDIEDSNAYEAAYSWIKEMAKRIRVESVNDLEYIRSAYKTVTTNFTYGAWPGGFTNLIARKQGDCGGISMAFVCLLREGGIPSREMVCIRPDQGCHVWTEFYLQNYGWISADPTFDLGLADGFRNFGNYSDNTIVMTYDTGFTIKSAGGVVVQNAFVQWLMWGNWPSWENPEETEKGVSLSTTWENTPGMLSKDGTFISTEAVWQRLDSFGVKSHVGFVFDGNYPNIGTNQFTLWNGQNCSYEKSPLGYALRLDHDEGAWTSDDLKFGNDWTILTIGKFAGVENVPLFCIGSSWGGNNGFVLASGRTNEVTLSFWQDASSHVDLISVAVPDSATKYHSYALRTHDLEVSLFVDGVNAGACRFPVAPQSNGLQFHSVYGGICNSGLIHVPGGCVDDWRLYNELLPDEMIMAYADLLLKYDENRAGETIEGNVIPHLWISRNGSDELTYEKACRQVQANGYPLWQCYVAGLIPSDSASKFLAFIEMVDGKAKLSFEPNLGNARKYTILGSSDLKNWHESIENVPFYKVKVDLP